MMDPATAREILNSGTAAELLATVAATDGSHLVAWNLDMLHVRPGAEVSATYKVQLQHGDLQQELYIGLTSADLAAVAAQHPGPGLVELSGPAGSFWAWRHPYDPMLPALQRISSVSSASAVVGAVARLEMLAYRPLRRAVLRIILESGQTIYAKVLRADRAQALVERHELMASTTLAAAPVVEYHADGLVLLAELPGLSLSRLLAAGERTPNFDPWSLLQALQKLPAGALNLTARQPPAARLAHYVTTVQQTHPDLSPQLHDLVAEILSADEDKMGAVVPTHGDLNTTNLITNEKQVVGFIDLDTLGPGYLVDDLAGLIAHIAALPAYDPRHYSDMTALLEACIEAFSTQVDCPTLLRRSAAHLLALVAGTGDSQIAAQWISIAIQWAQRRREMINNLSSTAPSGFTLPAQTIKVPVDPDPYS